MGDLSEHFDRSEFLCKGHGLAGHVDHWTPVDPGVLVILETLRAIDQRPLHIVSGHRCPWYNRRVGGAPWSQHLFGSACDLPAGRFTENDARRSGARGIGLRGQWVVHIDHRPGDRVVTWQY